jgi:phosphatidylglycerol---prolipoprotein diacylglyceryl transferase
VHLSYLQLGRLHIPVFGVVAAVGLLAALALSQRTARWRRLDPAKLWDAGMTAVILAFVVSRVLLVAFNWKDFLMYPMLLMAVPSLTLVGLLVTALLLAWYLRWKRLPVLAVLDAWAPCAALLWGFLSLARILDGTREGMPTGLPWGVRVAASFTDRVHPVEAYSLGTAVLLCAALLGVARRTVYTGRTVASGLIAGGVAIFFLDFFRVPSALFTGAWLDPLQVGAAAMVVAGSAVWLTPASKPHEEAGGNGVESAI